MRDNKFKLIYACVTKIPNHPLGLWMSLAFRFGYFDFTLAHMTIRPVIHAIDGPLKKNFYHVIKTLWLRVSSESIKLRNPCASGFPRNGFTKYFISNFLLLLRIVIIFIV